ncbi:MAG: carbonic anhydrase family protein [Rhizobacter sp.]
MWAVFSLPGAHAAASHDDAPAAAELKSGHAKKPMASAGKAAQAEEAVTASEAPSASGAAATKRPPRDPMDVIRERLAAKLGTSTVPDSATPGVVKVVSQTSAAPAAGVSRAMVTPVSSPGRVIGASPTHAARLEAAQLKASTGGHLSSGHWSYEGEGGPDSWGALQPEFATCSTGTRQSPIDISDGIKVELDAVQFNYRPSNFRVIDNGHTVQVNVAVGNTIEVTGKRYELVQFHFHRPSEERINGKPFDMVVHLVHKSVEGKLAVIAVLLDRGSAQPVVQNVWNNLPLEKGDEVMAKGQIDLMALLPSDRRYYTYMGSLTTPPCSEGVLWMVMKTPVEISPEQLTIFSRLYPMNARPIQSASGRIIKESN